MHTICRYVHSYSIFICVHTHTHKHIHTYVYKHTHVHTKTHIQTHTHTYLLYEILHTQMLVMVETIGVLGQIHYHTMEYKSMSLCPDLHMMEMKIF